MSSYPSPSAQRQNRSRKRSHVTIMFSDICSSTKLGDLIDPEILTDIYQMIKSHAELVVRQHGGFVNQYYGDGILAIFGYPANEENEGRRCVEACLHLHRLVRETSFAGQTPSHMVIRLHSGIHSGLVAVTEGGAEHGKYQFVGDPVNTAAGLCAVAGVDEILISSGAFRDTLPYFETKQLPALSLKGKDAPVPAHSVIALAKPKTRFEVRVDLGLAPFIGRHKELLLLKEARQAAFQGTMQVISVVGEAGVGKSRLLDQFLKFARQQDCWVYRGYSENYGSNVPLQPFVHILRQVFDLVATQSMNESREQISRRLSQINPRLLLSIQDFLQVLSLQLTTLAAPPNASPVDRENRKAVTVNEEALTELFVSLSKIKPIVMIFDDWQWADEASQRVFLKVLGALVEAKVLIITANRQRNHRYAVEKERVIHLLPFDKEDAERLCENLPNGLRLQVKQQVFEHSGGNALFIEEFCHAYEECSPVKAIKGAFPATLQGLLEARIAKLPADVKTVIDCASVIGNVIPLWLLRKVIEDQDLDRYLPDIANYDLIYQGESEGTLRFKHGITRDIVYGKVGYAERPILHRKIAEALEHRSESGNNEEHYELLAHHYFECGDFYKAKHYAKEAGVKALASTSLDGARHHFLVCFNAMEKLDLTPEMKAEWIAIGHKWSMPCAFSPAKNQLRYLKKSVKFAQELGDKLGEALALYWIGFIEYGLGNHVASIDFYLQSLRIVDHDPEPKLQAQLHATLGQSYAALCKYREALDFLDRAIDCKKRNRSASRAPVGSAYAQGCKATIVADRGRFDEAYNLFDEALSLIAKYEHDIESSILSIKAFVLIWQGRWQECLDTVERVQKEGRGINRPYVFASCQGLQGFARWKLEKNFDGLRQLEKCAQWMEKNEIGLYVSLIYGWLAEGFADAGERSKALKYALITIKLGRCGDRYGEPIAYRALARVADSAAFTVPSLPHVFGCALEVARVRESAHEEAVTRLLMSELCTKSSSGQLNAPVIKDLIQLDKAFERMGMDWHRQQVGNLLQKAQELA